MAKTSKRHNLTDISNVASARDTTGLMTTPPQDAEEYNSYQELSGMEILEIPEIPVRKKTE